MKNSLLLLFLIFIQVDLFSQQVSIPDAKFLSVLLEKGVDIDGNDKIELVEAKGIAFLDISNQGIKNLTGIEAFKNLTVLECSHNEITKLDLSKNTKLTSVDCKANKLTLLSVVGLTQLKELHCQENELVTLTLGGNVALTKLHCQHNEITSLDISSAIHLNDIDCSLNQLSALNTSTNTKLHTLNKLFFKSAKIIRYFEKCRINSF